MKKAVRNILRILLASAFLAAPSCEKPTIGVNDGQHTVIGAEDLTLELELTTETPVVYNEGNLVVKITTNRKQLTVVKYTSEFEFPEIQAGDTYEMINEISFTSKTAVVSENGEGEFKITVYDKLLDKNIDLAVTYSKTTDYAVMPTSITLSMNDFSISRGEKISVGYSVFPAEAKGNIGVKRVDNLDTELEYSNDTRSAAIRLTGGATGGKVRLKVYAVADTTVFTYLDLYVKHRVALELDIKSNDHIFWRDMPTSVTARLVSWVGDINENNKQEGKDVVSLKEFAYPYNVKATCYVNILSSQAGRESKYFYGGNKAKVWNTQIKMGGTKYFQWGETKTGTNWSKMREIDGVKRYSTYTSSKTKAGIIEIAGPGYHTVPELLTFLQDNNDYRWVSDNGKLYTNSEFKNGAWYDSKWSTYYITVEDLVYDKTKLDLVYVFHLYRLQIKSDSFYRPYSGYYYWDNADDRSWVQKVQ